MKRITNWNKINWKRCSQELKALQDKLAIASKKGYNLECKQLQAQIVRCFASRALAVKSVTSNRGKKTVGVDNITWDSSHKKERAIEQLKDLSNYKAQPIRRVWIPKKGTNEKRPLGIPTVFDRAVQKLWLFALDPIIESQSDFRSFGFRKDRSAKDAAEYIRLNCGAIYGKRIIGNTDIENFFDTLDHQWIIKNIPMNKKVLKQFLRAGIVSGDNQVEISLTGIPQGGVISPVIANAALNGLEALVENVDRCQIVRYADDFLILATEVNTIENVVLPKVKNFLNDRSLRINSEKSKIETIERGFNYLGYNFKEYPDVTRIKGTKKGIFLVKPAKENVSGLLKTCREIIKQNGNASSGHLILKLNPILRGWAEHYKSVVSSRVFNSINKAMYVALMQWMKRKHRNMPKKPLIKRYWKTVKYGKKINRWVFYGEDHRGNEINLFQIASTNIVRHNMIPIKDQKNPYLIKDEEFFRVRNKKNLKNTTLLDHRRKRLIAKQSGLCTHCKVEFKVTDRIELHHIIAVKDGGTDKLSNLTALHKECHNQITYKNKRLTKTTRG